MSQSWSGTTARLTRLQVSPGQTSVALGRVATFRATGFFSDQTEQEVNGQTPGRAIVTASYLTRSASLEVDVMCP